TMRICIISVLLLMEFSYNNYAAIENKPSMSISQLDEKQIKDDSLRDPYNYYYLTDIPLRHVAILLLTDSIEPSDNEITFDCMDSISSNNKESREFYFPVFLKILDKADGALAEVVGNYVIKYVEKFPKEFSNRAKNILTETQFNSTASYAGGELYFDEDN